mmetsp:Transcript_13152/g.36037  ORF Transcript_13152/g.36037 Transcript_13152/m.36037 type:complete len:267 (-) Transcript_13152:328-1128(-)
MDDEDLFCDHVAQRQQAECLAEELIQLLVVLFSYLTLEPIQLVHIPSLVVSSRKVHRFRVQKLPRKQDDDDLNRERTSIHEVPIEEVRVSYRRHAVDLPNVQKVVVLSVHVAADRELAVVGDLYVHESRRALQQGDHVEDDLVRVLLCEGLLVLLPLHQLLTKFERDFPAGVDGACISTLHGHLVQIQRLADWLSELGADGHSELGRLHLLLARLQLLSRVLVLRDQLTKLREVLKRILCPAQREESSASSVPALGELRLGLDRFG